jgi:hypothetical protein
MEPPAPPTTPASPFTPGRPRSPAGASRTKPLLIGCGAALILLGIAAVVLMVKLPEFVGWMFHRLEAQILAKLPPDVTPEERQRLDSAFDAAAEAIGSGKADRAKAEELNSVLMDFARMGRTMTREDVLKLTQALEETAGKTTGKAPP